MDRETRANLYRNVFGIAWIKPAIESGQKPLALHVVGTGLMLDSGIAVTAAHIFDGLTKMGVAGDHIALVFVIHEGGLSYKVIIDRLTANHPTMRITLADQIPIPHTNRLPIEPYTDIAVVPLHKDPPPQLGKGLDIADISELHIGDPVFLAGYMLGDRMLALPGKNATRRGPIYLEGRVAAVNPIGVKWHLGASEFLIDATCAGGLSGAPVCNNQGEVLGILTGGVEHCVPAISYQNPNREPDYAVSIPSNIGRVLPLNSQVLAQAREFVWAQLR